MAASFLGVPFPTVGGMVGFPAPLERAGTGASQAGSVAGFLLTPLERQGTLACPAGAPFLGKKWGKEPQREEVLPSGLPSLVGSGQKLYFFLVTWPAALTVKGP